MLWLALGTAVAIIGLLVVAVNRARFRRGVAHDVHEMWSSKAESAARGYLRRMELTPFIGECRDYRRVDGLLVPHEVNGFWRVDGQRIPFVRFRVERLEYDASDPF